MYMTDFIFLFSFPHKLQATCLQKLPDLPWLLLRHSWNLRLPFIFSPVETYFCPLLCNSSTPLQRTDSSLHSVAQTDSCCITVHSTGSLMCCEPVWVCLKTACERRLFIMTDLIGLFLPTPSPAVWDNQIKMVGCFPGFEYGTIIKVKMIESCTREAALNPKLCSSTMFFSFFPCNPASYGYTQWKSDNTIKFLIGSHWFGMYDDVELELICELSRSKVGYANWYLK